MELIIGGAYQGKLDYAKEEYSITNGDVFRCDETSTGIGFDERVIYHFERYVLALMKAGQDPERTIRNMIPAGRFKDRIVIADDISQGVVPMDEVDRAWRENTGRCLVMLAKEAEKVTRVFCGIPLVVKGEVAGAQGNKDAIPSQVKKDPNLSNKAESAISDIFNKSDDGEVIDVLTPHKNGCGGSKWGR